MDDMTAGCIGEIVQNMYESLGRLPRRPEGSLQIYYNENGFLYASN